MGEKIKAAIAKVSSKPIKLVIKHARTRRPLRPRTS